MSSGAALLGLMALPRWKNGLIRSLIFTELIIALSLEQEGFIHFVSSQDFDGKYDDLFYKDDFDRVDDKVFTERMPEADLEKNPKDKFKKRPKDELKKNQSYLVHCGEDAMKVIWPLRKLSEVRIFGMSMTHPVWKACGYSLTKTQGKTVLHVRYSACHVTMEQDGSYTLRVNYRDNSRPSAVASVSCKANSSQISSTKLHQSQSDSPSYKWVLQPPLSPPPSLSPPPILPPLLMPPATPTIQPAAMPLTQTIPIPPWSWTLPSFNKQAGCSIPIEQRLLCGPSGVNEMECQKKGCCMDMKTSACYYPMDVCTADKQFIFAIPADFMTFSMNPEHLVVAGPKPCRPVIVNKDFAVFKFAMTNCGTRFYQIGNTMVYMAEVQMMIKTLNLKYGIIFREQPVRVMVECRFPKFTHSVVKASAGYMVMSPSLPSLVRSTGLFGVQLRIAQDSTFSTFYPQCHQPLRILLGQPVYLELQLVSPKPNATLLVHYCLAYPRSAKNALVLLYEGCPNPLDSGNISILHVADLPQNRHKRHFEVKAFQFMDHSTHKYLDEEIYFMCSTEVCLESETPCKETCFDQK